ncbi:hypothetical protein SDC9_180747 [bioreactor metagenome]|uniref:Uncharacterized protein n=1 Tax=bioreactor metagenome TaxID=1076179 RepID=A0A645H4K5_9ZZZZ
MKRNKAFVGNLAQRDTFFLRERMVGMNRKYKTIFEKDNGLNVIADDWRRRDAQINGTVFEHLGYFRKFFNALLPLDFRIVYHKRIYSLNKLGARNT